MPGVPRVLPPDTGMAAAIQAAEQAAEQTLAQYARNLGAILRGAIPTIPDNYYPPATGSSAGFYVTTEDLQNLCAGSNVYTAVNGSVYNVVNGNSVWTNNAYVYTTCAGEFVYANLLPREPEMPARPENPTAEQLAEWETFRAAHEAHMAAIEAAATVDRAEWERRQRLEREAAAERQRKRDEAERKAELLLTTHLAPAQREQYLREKKFEVVLEARFQLRSKRYRIEHGWAGNVYLLDEQGRPVERYCIHHPRPVPVPDLMLAQKLMLETDEDQFLRIANRTRLVPA